MGDNVGTRSSYGDPAAPQNRKRRRDEIVKDYEEQLMKVKWGAMIIGGLHSACRFLAFCNLTWTTAVILSGFSSQFLPLDFAFVSILILIEAFRFATTVFFCHLTIRSLHSLSPTPFIPKKKDRQAVAMWVVRISSILLQILFIPPSLVLPSLHFHSRDLQHLSNVCNLSVSLQIFYGFVLANGAIALLAVFFSIVMLWLHYHPSMHRYYDEVLQRSFDYRVKKADDFWFLDFAVEMLRHDFSRHLRAEDIQQNKKQLIEYLHGHRNGPDVVLLASDSSDCFVQRAAACLVGFWTNDGLLEVPAHLPLALLSKLADKLGTLEIGWSAANSLAALDTITALSISNSVGKSVIDILISLIHPTRKRSLVWLHTLASWLPTEHGPNSSAELQEAQTKLLEKLNEYDSLVENLRTLSASSELNQVKVLAGYMLMGMDKLITEDECRPIAHINPQNDTYVLPCEEDMLRKLQSHEAIKAGNKDEASASRIDMNRDETSACTVDMNSAGPSTSEIPEIRSA